MGAELAIALCVGAATVLAAMGITTAAAIKLNRVAVVDITWGLGFVGIAIASAVVASIADAGEAWRSWLVAGLVTIWGGRLAWHVRSRATREGGGEDPRYEAMLGGTLDQVGVAEPIKRVFAVQGVAMWFISIPLMVGAVSDVDYTWLVFVGAAVWVIGFAFEAIGDKQLSDYKATPKEQRPQVMDQGLWRYTRHPNYFGDATMWWGLWLAAALASGWLPGLLTALSPIAMSYFLVFGTGAKLLEKTMMKRAGYPEYAERTSMFFPLPPKRSGS